MASIISQQPQISQAQLSPDQQKSLQDCTEFTSQEHTLSGFAGTGKSTLLAAIRNQCKHQGKTVQVCASTHKAVAVLAEKLNCDVTTFHALIGLRVSFDAGSGEMKLTLKGKNKIEFGAVVIIDESSMISFAELQHVRKAAQAKRAKILFVGDPYQLAPVKGSGSPALTQPKSRSELTTLHRQSEGNPLLEYTEAYRRVLHGEPFPEIVERFKDGCGVQVLDRDE